MELRAGDILLTDVAGNDSSHDDVAGDMSTDAEFELRGDGPSAHVVSSRPLTALPQAATPPVPTTAELPPGAVPRGGFFSFLYRESASVSTSIVAAPVLVGGTLVAPAPAAAVAVGAPAPPLPASAVLPAILGDDAAAAAAPVVLVGAAAPDDVAPPPVGTDVVGGGGGTLPPPPPVAPTATVAQPTTVAAAPAPSVLSFLWQYGRSPALRPPPPPTTTTSAVVGTCSEGALAPVAVICEATTRVDVAPSPTVTTMTAPTVTGAAAAAAAGPTAAGPAAAAAAATTTTTTVPGPPAPAATPSAGLFSKLFSRTPSTSAAATDTPTGASPGVVEAANPSAPPQAAAAAASGTVGAAPGMDGTASPTAASAAAPAAAAAAAAPALLPAAREMRPWAPPDPKSAGVLFNVEATWLDEAKEPEAGIGKMFSWKEEGGGCCAHRLFKAQTWRGGGKFRLVAKNPERDEVIPLLESPYANLKCARAMILFLCRRYCLAEPRVGYSEIAAGGGGWPPAPPAVNLAALFPTPLLQPMPGIPLPLDPKIDFVFVHGLGGKRSLTWETPEGVMWPRDFLVHDDTEAVAGAPEPVRATDLRVLSVSHEHTRTDRNEIGATIEALDAAVSAARAGADDRPLVWVAHSLGGLLVKELLRRRPDLLRCTRGVVFFACPHNGADTSLAADFSAQYLLAGPASPAVRYLSAAGNGDHLRALRQWFEASGCEFVNYVETKPQTWSSGIGVTLSFAQVVPTQSASMSGDRACPTDISAPVRVNFETEANHSQICKFSGRGDSTYEHLRPCLARWMRARETAPPPPAAEEGGAALVSPPARPPRGVVEYLYSWYSGGSSSAGGSGAGSSAGGSSSAGAGETKDEDSPK